MKLFNLKKIGESNPAQWTATNEQGELVYIRFRFDTLTVHCPFDLDDEKQNYESFMAVQILDMRDVYDDEYRGALDTGEMLALTGYTLESRAMSNFAETLLGKTIKAIYPEKDSDTWSERHYEVDGEDIICPAGVIIVEFTDGTSMRVWNSEWGGISKS